jgi:hypothetical protein
MSLIACTPSSNIIRIIKSRRTGWIQYVAHMGENRNVHRVLVEAQKERDQLEDTDADGTITGLREIDMEWINPA